MNERAPDHIRGCCSAKDARAVREAMKAKAKLAGLEGVVRINESGCLDQCEHGVTIVVYPETVWYGFVTPADVDEIVESHLIRGTPVARLRLPDSCISTSTCRHRGGVPLGLGVALKPPSPS